MQGRLAQRCSQVTYLLQIKKIAVLVCLVLWTACVHGLDPPSILNQNPMTINVGESLVLVCHGDEALHWELPQGIDNRISFSYSSQGNDSELADSASRPYATTLTVGQIGAPDSGLYTCRYNATEHETGIYVLVNESEETEVLNLTETGNVWPAVYAYVGESVTIPCKRTNPLGKMSLIRHHGWEELNLTKENYNAERGYTISSVSLDARGMYDCCEALELEEFPHCSPLLVVVHRGPLTQPPRINVTDGGKIQVGSDFRLDCFVEEDQYVYYTMVWVEPVRVINSSRASTTLDQLPSSRRLYRHSLHVINATKEDSGEYVCKAYNLESSRIASKLVTVYDVEERFLNVSTELANIQERAELDAKWVINVSSYPTAIDYAWLDKRGTEIGRSGGDAKYKVIRDGDFIFLKIVRISLQDSGKYKFIVKLKEYPDDMRELDMNLTVLAPPKVKIVPSEVEEHYLQYGSEVNISCTSFAFPLPTTVAWNFLDTSDFNVSLPRDCNSTGMKRVKASALSTLSPISVRSVLPFPVRRHGILRCTALNAEGIGCTQKLIKVIDFPGSKPVGLEAPDEVVYQDRVDLTCALSKLNGSLDIVWKRVWAGQEEVVQSNKSAGVTLKDVDSAWSVKRVLSFQKIDKSQAGEYVCLVGGGEWRGSVKLDVLDMIPPIINVTNLNRTEIVIKEGDVPELPLHCKAEGRPKPEIQWFKDDEPMENWPQEIKYTISENKETLNFTYIRAIASGRYTCQASNRNGTISTFMDIEVEGQRLHPALIAAFVIIVALLLVLLIWHVKRTYDKKQWENYVNKLKAQEELVGQPEMINPDLPVSEQISVLPYENKWEFPRDRLKLGMQLGSGAFGRVMKAEAVGILPHEPVTTVAVKMVKANADESHIKALMSELKIMVHLGKHVNVVNLLGAVTANLKRKELLVIVEFCKYGSLLSYLHRHRHTFINQLDPARGVIDSSIYKPSSRSSHQSEPPRPVANGYRTLEEIPPSNGNGSPVESFNMTVLNPMDGRQSVSTEYCPNESMCTDMSFVSAAPTTVCGTDGKRRSSGASSWGEGNGHYRGDYHHVDVRPIRSVDLLGWAFQISRGMEYLATRKVLHGDLAARNVLLSENNVVKICDFGLAKEMYKDYKYKKKSEGGLLPVKWMAIESIYYGLFSTQSDVWSFGVVLWELFTLGKTPYPGMEPDERFYKLLSEGYRMERPPLAPSSIYDIMTECWAHEASVRPSFSTLVDRIGDLMEEGHRQQYVDLNVPYDQMNREWLVGREDLLGKMSGADYFSVSARPSPERQYENVPTTLEKNEHEGYLVPKSPIPVSPQPALQYQNVPALVHEGQGQGQPPLANNPGYILMQTPLPPEPPTSSYVRVGAEEISATNMGYVAVGLPFPEDPNHSPSRISPSPQDYVPNNIFSSPKALEELTNSSANPNANRGRGRQKNDSGLGSIASSHNGNSQEREDESEGEEDWKLRVINPSAQHNLGYVSVGEGGKVA